MSRPRTCAPTRSAPGPFKFVEFKRGDSIKLVRNPDYWKKGKPYLDGIDWKIIDEPLDAHARLRRRRVRHDVRDRRDHPAAQGRQGAGAEGRLRAGADLRLDQSHRQSATAPPFNDPKIRKAMALTLDRKAFIDILSEGKANIGGVMLPPPEGVWGMPPDDAADAAGLLPPTSRRAGPRRARSWKGSATARPSRSR